MKGLGDAIDVVACSGSQLARTGHSEVPILRKWVGSLAIQCQQACGSLGNPL